MNVLALDFGLKRIGTAVGSAEIGIAFGRNILKNNSGLLEELSRMIEDEKINRLVIGNPHRSNVAQVSIIDDIEKFIDLFEEKFPNIPHEFLDERFTSIIATKKLHAVEMKEKDQKHVKDSVVAQIILQEWLEQRALKNE
jgi:putative holliday junction resolvase